MAFFLARLSDVPAGRALFVGVGGNRLPVVLLLIVTGCFCADVAGAPLGPFHPLWVLPPVGLVLHAK